MLYGYSAGTHLAKIPLMTSPNCEVQSVKNMAIPEYN